MDTWKTLNVVTLLGMIVLFILFFTKPAPERKQEAEFKSQVPVGERIVFINSDTLREHYILVQEVTEKLEADYSEKERDIASRQQRYEKDATYFQQQVQTGALSEQSAQMIYEDLMRNQQELLDLRDKYTDEIAQKEYRMNERFVDSVYNFLERYNADNKYDYILGYSRGSGILNAKDTLDITWDVIRLMNEEYRQSTQKTGD